jgi:hypothetical protein
MPLGPLQLFVWRNDFLVGKNRKTEASLWFYFSCFRTIFQFLLGVYLQQMPQESEAAWMQRALALLAACCLLLAACCLQLLLRQLLLPSPPPCPNRIHLFSTNTTQCITSFPLHPSSSTMNIHVLLTDYSFLLFAGRPPPPSRSRAFVAAVARGWAFVLLEPCIGRFFLIFFLIFALCFVSVFVLLFFLSRACTQAPDSLLLHQIWNAITPLLYPRVT